MQVTHSAGGHRRHRTHMRMHALSHTCTNACAPTHSSTKNDDLPTCPPLARTHACTHTVARRELGDHRTQALPERDHHKDSWQHRSHANLQRQWQGLKACLCYPRRKERGSGIIIFASLFAVLIAMCKTSRTLRRIKWPVLSLTKLSKSVRHHQRQGPPHVLV